MKKVIILGGVVIVIGLGAFFFFQPSEQLEQEPVQTRQDVPTSEGNEADGEAMMEDEDKMKEDGTTMEKEVVEHLVIYSDSGYSPQELTIKMGDKVTFRNESSRKMWPATVIHPSHTVYPGSGIQKCLDEEADTSGIFDACADVEGGGEWSFVFAEKGAWKYHDHRRPSEQGTIIVE